MCRGTTNFEDVYIVNVDNIPFSHVCKMANPKWIQNHGGIPVDKCIGREIQELVNAGVITVGSCCGHGNYEAHALVSVESEDLLYLLGYNVEEFSDEHTEWGIKKIVLKSGDYSWQDR